MTVYVLGAGASVHAGYPLASQLLTSLNCWAQEYFITRESELNAGQADQFQNLIADLQSIASHYGSTADVEAILTDLTNANSELLQLRPSGILWRVQQGVREYFEALRKQEAPLYRRLASEKVSEGDVILTFNYDLGIERELRYRGLWDIRDGYGFFIENNLPTASSSKVRLLKLHGSTNWAGPMFGGQNGFGKATSVFGARPLIPFTNDYEYLGYNAVLDGTTRAGTASYGFAMILPTRRKVFCTETNFGREWEDFWNTLFDQAQEALQRASKIVVIGYSLPEADSRARDLLLQNGHNREAQVVVSCGTDSDRIASEFRASGFRNISVDCPTFERWLEAEYPEVNTS